MIYPKTIRDYKATPHKIVRNIDGEWYESRPTKEVWPAGSKWIISMLNDGVEEVGK